MIDEEAHMKLWEGVNKLHEIERARYQEMKDGVRRGLSVKQTAELQERWRAAHRLWWEEIDRVMAIVQSG